MKELDVRITVNGIGKALQVIYPNLDISQFASEWNKLVTYSKFYPKEARDVRAAIIHHKDNIGDMRNDKYVNLLNYIKGLERKYGNRSIVLRTLINAVSACERSIETVQREYRNSVDLPPAYDSTKRHYLSDEDTDVKGIGRNIRRKVIQWVRDNRNKDICLKQMSELFDPNGETIKDIQNRPRHFAILRNGSRTPIRFQGKSVLDIR